MAIGSPVAIGREFSKLKIVIIAILAIASGLLSSFAFSSGIWLFGFLGAALFLILFTLQGFFVSSDKSTLALVVLLETVALSAPFFRVFTLNYVLLVLILFLMLYLGSLSGAREINNTLKLSFFRIARIVTVAALTAYAVFLSSMYMGFGGGTYLTDSQVKSLVGFNVDPVMAALVSGYTPETSLEELLKAIAINALGPEEREALNQFSRVEQDEALRPLVQKLEKDLENYLLSPVDLKKTLTENIINVASYRVSGLESDAKIILAIVLFMVAWFTAKSLAFLVYYPIAILTFLIYEFLLMSGFVYVQLETGNREVIVLR